jgi:hypothetical protein
MRFSKILPLCLVFFTLGLTQEIIEAQSTPKKPTRQSSFEAFSKGDYETAYLEFGELLKVYTKDPLYKYYSGVCLVKLNSSPSKAVDLIQQSLQGATAVKSVSSDAWFYLGRARQMAGSYLDAVEAYNLYTEQVGKKTSREQGVPQYIQQCMDNKGALSPSEAKKEPVAAEPAPVTAKSTVSAAAVTTVAAAPSPLPPAEKKVTPKKTVSSEYELILSQALEYQIKADSLTSLAGQKKGESASQSGAERQQTMTMISGYEAQAASFQKMADAKYEEARLAMNPQQKKSDQTPQVIVSTPAAIASDSPGTNKAAAKAALPAGSLILFEILPKPVTDPKAKIVIDPEIPAGLVYRMQMGVFRNPVAPSFFKGITPVYGFRVAGTDKTNYFAGMFRKMADAKQALAAIKAKGFKDSFIVGLVDGKTVSADRAAMLEKEWGNVPFAGIKSQGAVTASDTIPPELLFRVEVIRSAKPLKDDAVDAVRKLAGSRGMDIRATDDGKTSYLVGKFITFASAEEYAGLIVRNGYPEAKVVAFLGQKEIPVETAKGLFEK